MFAVRVQIVRFTDPAQPGWVECVLRDALDRNWVFSDKVPIFSANSLDADSIYPQPGVIACEIVRDWVDEVNRQRCIIDTNRPWGVAAQSGETQFEVFYDQLAVETD